MPADAAPQPAATPTDFGLLGACVGHATDDAGATGCTVVRGIDGPLRAAVAIVGRATGTRELALLEPGHLVDRIDALLLSGGSAYGLDAAAGVMRWCEAHGRGFDVGAGVVPIVPAAVIFDLLPLGRFDARPSAEMAWSACESATGRDVAEGSVGAGTGATVGKARGAAQAMKGGVGCAIVARDGLMAGAVVVVNAFGTVCDAAGRPIAGARGADGRPLEPDGVGLEGARDGARPFAEAAGRSTTIGAVLVDVGLDRVALGGVARAATAAYHRRIRPAGTPFDGDVLFALAPLRSAASSPADAQRDPVLLLQLEALATAALEQAIERAVRLARGRDGIPGLADQNLQATDG